jgi:uncharacterized membrane protein
LASLNSAQAGSLLALLGCAKTGKAVVRARLTGHDLLHVTEKRLAELGVATLIQRQRLLAQLAELKGSGVRASALWPPSLAASHADGAQLVGALLAASEGGPLVNEKRAQEVAVAMKRMADAGALPQLVVAMGVHKRSAGVQQAACQTLRTIALGSDSSTQAVVDAGALQALVAAMRSHGSSAAVQEAACGALETIALGSDTRTQAVVAAGALPQLVAALRAHAGSAGVQEAACKALQNIASGSNNLEQAVVDAGALPQLVAAMRAHASSAAVQEAACKALQNIASGSKNLEQAVVDAGALLQLVAAMRAHASSADVQQSA